MLHSREGPFEDRDEMAEFIYHTALSETTRLGVPRDLRQDVASQACLNWFEREPKDASAMNTRRITASRACLATYIRVTTRNAYFSMIRSDKRRLARENRYAQSDSEEARVRPRDPSGVEAWLGRRAMATEIYRLLPKRRRAVAYLYWIEGLSIREVSETLDLTIGQVKGHLHASRRILRRRLSKDDLL